MISFLADKQNLTRDDEQFRVLKISILNHSAVGPTLLFDFNVSDRSVLLSIYNLNR